MAIIKICDIPDCHNTDNETGFYSVSDEETEKYLKNVFGVGDEDIKDICEECCDFINEDATDGIPILVEGDCSTEIVLFSKESQDKESVNTIDGDTEVELEDGSNFPPFKYSN